MVTLKIDSMRVGEEGSEKMALLNFIKVIKVMIIITRIWCKWIMLRSKNEKCEHFLVEGKLFLVAG